MQPLVHLKRTWDGHNWLFTGELLRDKQHPLLNEYCRNICMDYLRIGYIKYVRFKQLPFWDQEGKVGLDFNEWQRMSFLKTCPSRDCILAF